MRVRLIVSFVLALASVTPAAAAPKRPALAGTVRITASRTSVVDVRLPRAIDLSTVTPAKGSSVTGDGRIVGAILLPVDQTVSAELMLLRFGLCDTEGCRSPLATTHYHYRSGVGMQDRTERLPAGNYQLLIVTDGKPVTVVLTLPGLKGSASFRPVKLVQGLHRTIDFGPLAAPPVQTMYTGSASFNVDGGRGLLLHQFTVATDVSVQQQGGFCQFEGRTGAEPAPGCPTGSGLVFSVTRVEPDPARWGIVGFAGYLDEGEYHAGPFYRTVGSAHDPVATVTMLVIPKP